MNRVLAFSALVFASGMSLGDELFISDDQILNGEVISSTQGLLKLKHPLAEEILTLDRNKVRKISFDREVERTSEPNEILFLDGSRLSGRLTSFDNGLVGFKSKSVGELKFQSDKIASLFFHGPKQRSLFAMDGRRDQWTLGENSEWEFDAKTVSMVNGKSSATAGLMVKLPDHYLIDFEASWPKQPKFELLFGGDELSYGADSNYYKLVVNRGGLEIRRVSKGERRSVPLNAEVDFDFSIFQEEGKARLSIDVDRRNQVITLYIDNEIVGKFNDFENGTALGDAIFYKAGSAGQKITAFSLSQVSGGSTVERDEALAMDQLVSIEGDRAVGSLDELIFNENGDKLLFTRKHGEEESKLPVSLENIEVIHFKGPKLEEPKNSDLTKTASGDKIFGRVGEISDESISISSPAFGEVQLLRRAAESILFEEEEKKP